MSIALVVALVMLLALLSALVGGVLLLARSRTGGLGFPACGGCQYDLTGSIGSVTRCPECGGDIAVVGIIPPGGRRNPTRVAVGVMLVLLSLMCLGGMAFSLLASRSVTRVAPLPPPVTTPTPGGPAGPPGPPGPAPPAG
ncbi:MAG: hypothetical protein ACYTG1_05245 [Planctomycetota bacterium]|jgi:hypothetical protein